MNAGVQVAPTPVSGWRAARRIVEESAKYLGASLAALAVDYALLVFLTEVVHLHYLVSAAIGFTAGLFVTYVLSITVIFRERRYGRGIELAGFVVIGLAGLILNEFLLRTMVERLGVNYAIAKAPAAGVSFMFNFVVRRAALFTTSRAKEIAPVDA